MIAIVHSCIGAEVEQLPDPGVADRTKPRLAYSADVTDDELVRAVCTGDHAAFAEITSRHFDQVYRVAWRVLGGSADAEDVAQEAFIKFWRTPQSLKNPGAVRPWLMRVATNLAIDRQRRKQPQLMDELPDIADDQPSPENTLTRSEVAHRVDAAIAQLPDRQRIALVLTYYENMSNQQTGDIMELSVDAVESLLSRARRNLKAQLAERWRDMLDELSRQ